MVRLIGFRTAMKNGIDEKKIKTEIGNRKRRELPLENFVPASVLIPILAFDGPPRIVLTVRTAEVEHHKNQISFPGGRQAGDETSSFAALRETHEEVGIRPEAIRLLGALDDIYTISNYRVTPYVGWIDTPVELIGSPRETALILVPPISDLLDPAIHREEKAFYREHPITMHFFEWKSHIIWGATGLILDQFLDICRR